MMQDFRKRFFNDNNNCPCPRGVSLFLRERSVKDVSSISEWAEVFANSRDCVGIKLCKNSSNGRQRGEPKDSRSPHKPGDTDISRPPMRCFLCKQVGHKAAQCRSGKRQPWIFANAFF